MMIGSLYIYDMLLPVQNKILSSACTKFDNNYDDFTIYSMDKIYELKASILTGSVINFQFIMSLFIIQLIVLTILMLERNKYTSEMIIMLKEIFKELMMFFATFGLFIVIFWVVGRFLGYEIKKKGATFWTVFVSLFNTFVGKPDFTIYTFPVGSIYILLFLVIFKVLLLSLLVAMYINKY